MFQPVGRRYYNYYFDDRRDCIRYSVTVGLSRCRVHFSTPNVALKCTYQKKKRPLGSPKPHTSPDHVFSVAFIVVILVFPYKNNGNCDLSYPRLKSPYTPDKTIKLTWLCILCFVTRIAKLSRNHGSSFVKSELSLPWNPEVLSLTNEREAKRRNAREPLGAHVNSFERADPIRSRLWGFRGKLFSRLRLRLSLVREREKLWALRVLSSDQNFEFCGLCEIEHPFRDKTPDSDGQRK